MNGTNGGPPLPDFTAARRWGGVALIATAIIVALVDAFRTDVTVDVWQFGLILGSGLLLLGVQGLDRFIKP